MPSKDQILDEIRSRAEGNGGRPLGNDLFAQKTGISPKYWGGVYWARWNDAVREAGLTPNEMPQKFFTDEDVLRLICELTVRLGHIPTISEMTLEKQSNPDFPGKKIVRDRVGNRDERLLRIAEFSSKDERFRLVYELCLPHMSGPTSPSTEATETSGSIGSVYLIRSGKNYKIGHTNNVGRRHYEIGLQLPHKAELIHHIETDDPEGIEAYWHQRFADQRLNGEWFSLTKKDIDAFKRHKKFM
jgi:hypothetical protein